MGMSELKSTVLAGGCFWCLEAVFQRLNGVTSVESGYMGGKVERPTYEQVCGGNTGHAEVVKVTYDPSVVSFLELLAVFFTIHDPTTPNRQGNDVGTQYRSAIYYADEEQKREAEGAIAELTAQKAFDRPIVTEVAPQSTFYKAEGYHQNYFNNNANQPYCQFVVWPKVEKFEKYFAAKMKAEAR
jgi:peptide-methionine (S)-S-oxide reductase